MTKAVAIIPYVYEPYFNACMATLQIPRDMILAVGEVPPDNNGQPAAFNKGIDFMRKKNADWLILINPAMRFGKEGGLDMLEWLNKSKANVVFFGNKDVMPQAYQFEQANADNFAWHCAAWRKEVFDAIGKLDTNFYPTYFEDIDFDLRYQKHFGNKNMEVLPIDARNESHGHSIKLAGINVDTNALITYFATKWGRHPSATGLNSYDRPFNNSINSLAFFPPARGQVWNE